MHYDVVRRGVTLSSHVGSALASHGLTVLVPHYAETVLMSEAEVQRPITDLERRSGEEELFSSPMAFLISCNARNA